MGDEYNAPEAVNEEMKGGGKQRSAKLQRLRPYVAGDTVANHVQILLMNPSVFTMFRGVVGPEFRLYTVPLWYHYMGRDRDRAQTLCKKEANTYYAEKYGAPLIYAPATCPTCGMVGTFLHCTCGTSLGARVRDDICPSCDESKRRWAVWSKEWDAQLTARGLPTGNDSRRKLKNTNRTLYDEIIKSTRIGEYQEIAGQWTASERYLYIMFDNDKLMQRRSLLEGESPDFTMTILFGGTSVEKVLKSKHNNGKRFWAPDGGMEIVITRDTTKGMERASYTVDDAAGPTFSPEWLAYLTNYQAMPDPSTEVTVMSYDEHVNKAGLALTREEVVAQPDQPSVGSPPASAPPATPPSAALPSAPPTSAAPPMGRGPLPPAPAPFQPPATPPTVGMGRPPAGPPTVGGPPPLGSPPVTSAPPPPVVPAAAPVPGTPPAAPGAPPVPQDSGRRQTW